jgi:hypothetical protein
MLIHALNTRVSYATSVESLEHILLCQLVMPQPYARLVSNQAIHQREASRVRFGKTQRSQQLFVFIIVMIGQCHLFLPGW